MKVAVTYGPGEIGVEEVERPAPGAGEVLLRVKAAGICGSDLHFHRRPAGGAPAGRESTARRARVLRHGDGGGGGRDARPARGPRGCGGSRGVTPVASALPGTTTSAQNCDT